MANFNFFGDSWYWTWHLGQRESVNNPGSNDLRDLSPYGVVSNDLIDLNLGTITDTKMHQFSVREAHSLYEIYLKHLGHTAKTFCYPGQTWFKTVNSILDTKLNGKTMQFVSKSIIANSKSSGEVDLSIKEGYTVIFYSSIIRGPAKKQHPVHSKKEMYNYIKQCNIDSLTTIADWATENKQKVILLGGQSCFDKVLFDRWKHNNPTAPIVLGSSDLLATLVRTFVDPNYFSNRGRTDFGYWKLSTDVDIDETWDIELLNDLDDQQTFYEEVVEKDMFVKPYLFPDGGHPSLLGQYHILDLILSVKDKFN